MDKLTAGEKLRRQAIERTRRHIEAQRNKGTALRKALRDSCYCQKPEDYLALEQRRLNELEAGL